MIELNGMLFWLATNVKVIYQKFKATPNGVTTSNPTIQSQKRQKKDKNCPFKN